MVCVFFNLKDFEGIVKIHVLLLTYTYIFIPADLPVILEPLHVLTCF